MQERQMKYACDKQCTKLSDNIMFRKYAFLEQSPHQHKNLNSEKK